MRLREGDAYAGSELRRLARAQSPGGGRSRRTVGELRAKARVTRQAREVAEAERRRTEELRVAEEAERPRRARLASVSRRGASVRTEIETEIGRRDVVSTARYAALWVSPKQIS